MKIKNNQILNAALILTLFVGGCVYFTQESDALISNGANAVDLLGQYTDNSMGNPVPLYTKRGNENSPNQYGFSVPVKTSIDTVNHRLFVADSNNYRVLVFNLNSSNQLVDREADFVIGQPNFHTSQSGTTASTFSNLTDIAYDSANNRLFVADNGNYRVLVFDTTTIINGMNASYVIGQPNFTTNTLNAPNSKEVYAQRIAYDSLNQRLFVSDAQSHSSRVMVYDVNPGTIANYPDAIGVLGQADFTTSVSGTTDASHLTLLSSLAYDSVNNWLYVSDGFVGQASRVLVFDVATTTPLEPAIFVLGQADFVSRVTVTNQSSITHPTGIAVDEANGRVFIGDDSRLLVFDTTAMANGMNATNVLFQNNFTTLNTGSTDSLIQNVNELYFDPVLNRLYVPDGNNNRVLVIDTATITNGEPAVDVYGQTNGTSASSPSPSFTKNVANDGGNLWGFSNPSGVAYDTVNHKMFVTDGGNCRIMVYNLDSTNSLVDRIPDYVIGQSSFLSDYTQCSVSATTLNGPAGSPVVDTKNNRLFVSDTGGKRVLVYNLASLATGMSASYVLGQPDFVTSNPNTTQDGLNYPRSMSYDRDSDRLFVSDTDNHRVMVFNVAPGTISNGMSASNVLGQPDFVTTGSNLSQSGFDSPRDVEYVSLTSKLYVLDQNNNRVLEFDAATSTIADGSNAVHVLGQPDFVTNNCNLSQNDLCTPTGITYDSGSGRLYVSDGGNNRTVSYIVGFNGVSTDFDSQISVLGQPDFTTNSSATTQAKMDFPVDLSIDPGTGKLAVADQNSNRVMIFDASTTVTTVPINMGTGTDGAEGGANGNFVINTVSTSTPYIIYFTLSGTATNGTDYTTIPLSVYVPANTSSVNIPVSVISDSLTEGTETVILTLASTTHFAVAPGSGGSATINITDGTSGSSSGGGGGVVTPIPQTYNGTTYLQSTSTTSTGGSVVSNSAAVSTYNNLFKQNNLPDLIGGAEPGVPKEFSNYVCQRYLREYILPGQKNNPSEVKKLQIFLNENEGEKLVVDGSYDADDIVAVKRFQAKYLDQIMAPWGADAPTGRVFRTTTAKVNLLMCAKQRGCPYFKEYLRKGDESLEAVKVQDFLNVIFAPTSGYPTNATPLTKEYDSPTQATVSNFQNVYKEIVLKPWELTSATGRWYQTTRHAANKLMNCNEGDIQLDNGRSFK